MRRALREVALNARGFCSELLYPWFVSAGFVGCMTLTVNVGWLYDC
jgi:hypothetical protein